MPYETILVGDENQVRTITLNRPDELNAVDGRVTKELQKELKAVSRDKSVRCLVLTGSGRAFCAGQDLKDATSGDGPLDFAERLRTGYNPVIAQLRSLGIPAIASVNGVAAGAGWSLALACDLRIASNKAKFVLAFDKIGLVPDSGMTMTLPRLVGYAKALEIAWFGEPITAETALQMGLVNRLAEPEALGAATKEWAEALAKGPTKGFALTKQAMNAGLNNVLEAQLEYEAMLQGIAGRTKDYQEGVRAFIEKRQPEYTGE